MRRFNFKREYSPHQQHRYFDDWHKSQLITFYLPSAYFHLCQQCHWTTRNNPCFSNLFYSTWQNSFVDILHFEKICELKDLKIISMILSISEISISRNISKLSAPPDSNTNWCSLLGKAPLLIFYSLKRFEKHNISKRYKWTTNIWNILISKYLKTVSATPIQIDVL